MDSTTPPPAATTTATAATAASPATSGAKSTRQFTIPQMVLDKYPDLVESIKKTESMSDDERDYWFQILPIMTDEQVARLKNILNEEATQLAKLDDQYQGELAKLNKKHLEEWNAFERKQDRAVLQQAEAKNEAEEAAKEEELLKKLDATGNAGGAPTDAGAAGVTTP